MNLISQLIFNICLGSTDPNCIETLHVCMRDVFEINFFDELTKPQEAILPFQLVYCQTEQELTGPEFDENLEK